MKVVLLPKKTRGGTVVAQMHALRRREVAVRQSARRPADRRAADARHEEQTRQQIQDETDRLKAQLNVSGRRQQRQRRHRDHRSQSGRRAASWRPRSCASRRSPRMSSRRCASSASRGSRQARAIRRASRFLELSRHLAARLQTRRRALCLHARRADRGSEEGHARRRPKFYAQFYGASNGEFVITGQFDKDEVAEAGRPSCSATGRANAPYARILNPYRKVTARQPKIETPDKQNAMFIAGVHRQDVGRRPRLSRHGARQLHARRHRTGARLFKRIRDKEGLSYGVASMLQRADQGRWRRSSWRYAISAPQNTPKAEASLKDELARTVKDGFTAEEVAAAKKAWLQERMVGRVAGRGPGRPADARERYDRTLNSTRIWKPRSPSSTPQQITEAFRRHVDLASLSRRQSRRLQEGRPLPVTDSHPQEPAASPAGWQTPAPQPLCFSPEPAPYFP